MSCRANTRSLRRRRAFSLLEVILAIAIGAHVMTEAARVRRRYTAQPAWIQGVGYAALGILVFLFSPASERFIYFQF